MDIRDSSAMTEASGLANEQVIAGNASREPPNAAKVKPSSPRLDQPSQAAARLSDQLRKMVREAPLQSVFAAFLLGVLVARRR